MNLEQRGDASYALFLLFNNSYDIPGRVHGATQDLESGGRDAPALN